MQIDRTGRAIVSLEARGPANKPAELFNLPFALYNAISWYLARRARTPRAPFNKFSLNNATAQSRVI